ncbi:MAG: hypothetical protein ACI93R_003848 [Flavobacteriales bacterium]
MRLLGGCATLPKSHPRISASSLSVRFKVAINIANMVYRQGTKLRCQRKIKTVSLKYASVTPFCQYRENMNRKLMIMTSINIALGFFSGSSNAKATDIYPSIFLNTSSSENFELIKITGNRTRSTAGEPVYIKENKTFIVQTETPYHDLPGADDWVDWWRINEHGYLIDVYSAPDNIRNSGVIFSEHYYVDWIYSGEHTKKSYLDVIDADALTETELTQYLERAPQVDFETVDHGHGYYIYIKNNRGWIALKTKNDPYKLHLTYQAKETIGLLKLKNVVARGYDWGKPDNFIYIGKTKRKGSSVIPWLDFNSNGWKGKFGPANFSINLENEKINFSALNIINNGKNEPDLRAYKPPELSGFRPGLYILELHGRTYNQRDAQEIGMYVVRPKIENMPDAVAKLEKDGVSFGTYISDNTMHNWHLVFEGADGRAATFQNIRYFNGTDNSSKITKNVLTSPKQRYIPKELDLSVPIPPTESRNEFKLILGNKYYTWDKGSTFAHGRLNFDKTEITHAFMELSSPQNPMQLLIKVKKSNDAYVMTMHVQGGSKKIELKHTKFATTAYSHDIAFEASPSVSEKK